MSLSHRPVGELTNTGVGTMGLNRGRPIQFHRPLVGPQKGRLPLLVPWAWVQPQGAWPLRHSLSKLWVIPARNHSLWAAPNPRLINRRNPCPSLTCPNTGSTSTPRFLYRARPRFVSSLRSILSLGLSPFGIRPRGHPFSRSIFRCFQSLVVAIRSSGIPGQEQALMLASLQYPASARPAFGRSSMPAAFRVCAMVWSIGSSCCTSLASWVTPTATMICPSLTTAWAL